MSALQNIALVGVVSSLTVAGLGGCAPVAAPAAVTASSAAVRLDDASAAAYQAGREIQMSETAQVQTQTAGAATGTAEAIRFESTQAAALRSDSATAQAAALLDAWTATAYARTEVYAAGEATLAAAAWAATSIALTPTPTPPPTQTPEPTWTATPDATAAAYVQDQARAERDNAVFGGLLVNGLLGIGFLVLLALGLYGVGRLYASWLGHMAAALRERYMFAGPDVLNIMSEIWVRETPAAVTVVDQAPPVDRRAAVTAQLAEDERWDSMLRIFFTEGNKSGFSLRAMTKPEGSKVCSEDDWRRITGHFAGSGILRDAGGNVGMTWGHGWDLGRLLDALSRMTPPPGDPPYCLPRVTVHTTARRNTAQHSTTEVLPSPK